MLAIVPKATRMGKNLQDKYKYGVVSKTKDFQLLQGCTMKIKLKCLIASPLLVAVLSACQTSPAPVTKNSWAKETKNDLEFIRDKLHGLHPAFVVKPDVPEVQFLSWYEKGSQIALKQAASVTDFPGYYFTLKAYTVGFEDEHLSLGLSSLQSMEKRLPSRWPGFTVAADQDHQLKVVRHDSPNGTESSYLPEPGATLLDCDGEEAQVLLRKNIFPYYGSEKLEKNWKSYAPRLLVDQGNPHVPLPKKCRFKEAQGARMYEMQFQPIEFKTLWTYLNPSQNTDVELRHVKADWSWLTLPTFSPTEPQAEKLLALLSELPKHRTSHMVIDLRGNRGGSSSWGTEILQALFSKEYIALIRWKSATGTNETYEYRVSQEGSRYFQNLLGNKNKNISVINPFFTYVASALQVGLQKDLSTVVVPMTKVADKPKQTPKNPVKHPVIVITDEHCFSACLNFIDLLKLIPNTTHVGRVTSADAVYMQDLDEIPLQGGDLALTIPILRVHNRRRGHNEPHTPDVPFSGDISDTGPLQEFVLSLQK
jgi:hypothetical protein